MKKASLKQLTLLQEKFSSLKKSLENLSKIGASIPPVKAAAPKAAPTAATAPSSVKPAPVASTPAPTPVSTSTETAPAKNPNAWVSTPPVTRRQQDQMARDAAKRSAERIAITSSGKLSSSPAALGEIKPNIELGSLRSGKKIMSDVGHDSHKEWSPEDHGEASAVLRQLRADAIENKDPDTRIKHLTDQSNAHHRRMIELKEQKPHPIETRY